MTLPCCWGVGIAIRDFLQGAWLTCCAGQLSDLSEVRGGSAWGAGTFAGGDGSRQPSAKELEIAQIQGKTFYETVARSFK